MRRLIAIAAILLPGVAFASSSSGGKIHIKAPWSLTDDERLALRLDTHARTSRVDAFILSKAGARSEGAVRSLATSQASAERPADVIIGSEHPELLLPFEIFGVFIRAAYGKDDNVAETVRRDAVAKATALGLPADFLVTIEREAAPFIVAERDADAIRNGSSGRAVRRLTNSPGTGLADIETRECPLRALAIKRLRSIYGARFDEFLYSAIAPGVFKQIDTPQTETELRRKLEGCR